MNYVTSDIHGEHGRFQQLLETIHFCDTDTLYVLGDNIDRGPHGVEVIEDIMRRPNIIPLLGNHELMCLQALFPKYHPEAFDLWTHYNGGKTTYRTLKYKRTAAERAAIIKWISGLPDHLNVKVGDRAFHLVHAFPGASTHDRVWMRPKYDTINPFKDGRTVIVRHTVVVHFLGNQSLHDAVKNLEVQHEHMEIVHAPGFIAIDCGCGNRTPARRLACLRLEDFQEFYV